MICSKHGVLRMLQIWCMTQLLIILLDILHREEQLRVELIPSFAEKVGLKLPQHEEMFTGGLNKRFGGCGIDASSRAHTAFLNKLRSDQFASMMDAAKTAGLDPETNLNIAKAYAEFINAGTGRGSLGRLERKC